MSSVRSPVCVGSRHIWLVLAAQSQTCRRCRRLTTLFGTPGIATGIQLSIAEALLLLEDDMPGGHATALKDRPDCPPQVANLIVNRLRN